MDLPNYSYFLLKTLLKSILECRLPSKIASCTLKQRILSRNIPTCSLNMTAKQQLLDEGKLQTQKKMKKFRGTFSPFNLAHDLVSPAPKALPQRLSVCSKLIYLLNFNPKRAIPSFILTNKQNISFTKNNKLKCRIKTVQFNRVPKYCSKNFFLLNLPHLLQFPCIS